LVLGIFFELCALSFELRAAPFRAGAAVADITPTNYPVLVNAMFTERSATKAVDPLHARALVLDDGATRLTLCVVDTCMMSRDLIDEAKELARAATGIPTDRMLVSATHTHSAPSAMGCLGSRQDTNYARFLPGRIAAAIAQAARNLAPALVGWTAVDDWEHTHNRRWVRRPDRMLEDPFGQRNVRAHMHPGHESKDAVGPSGPVDPAITILSVISPDGLPIALLANYSMHYYESPLLSADYFGRFASKLAGLLGATNGAPPFVGIMSQGTSGDLMWMDYGRPRNQIGYDAYAGAIAQKVFAARESIKYHGSTRLVMRETTLALNYRAPDEQRLAWARTRAASLQGRLPQSLPDIYALEAIHLHERPRTELKLQAVRIGDFGIAAIPNEVFAITGLKLKAQSPLQPLMNIELANGAEGYIPPPEQHKLGGYTTWPARTAGLETNAEPRIVETLLALLEDVSGKPRRQMSDTHGPYAKAVLASKPLAYWRLNESSGTEARNAAVRSGGHPGSRGGRASRRPDETSKSSASFESSVDFRRAGRAGSTSGETPAATDRERSPSAEFDARYEDGVALYLRGVESVTSATNIRPQQPNAFSGDVINRAPHFAGGRVRAEVPVAQTGGLRYGLADQYTVTFWFWNGLPNDARPVTGYLFSRGVDGAEGAPGDHLGIGGTAAHPGRLIFFNGNRRNTLLAGETMIAPKTWHHVVFIRDGPRVEVWLDGRLDITGAPEAGHAPDVSQLFFGGRNDNFANLEGKIDEVAVFDRVLSPAEIRAQLAAAGDAIPASTTRDAAALNGPLKPDVALRSFETEPGLSVELAAAEPAISDPVAVCWDERGRMFVAESLGYPTGGPGGSAVGGIAMLEDKNGDGRYERRTEFATSLTFPNGLMPWRGGLIVTCAPDVFYLKDTNGDGRADVKEILLTGFATNQSTQLRVNKPMIGLDGWIYLASGLSGGRITSPKRPDGKPLELKGDLRFKPDTGEYEHIDGKSQFGQSFDDFGRRFGVFNRVQVQHFVLPSHYVERNPHLASPGVMHNCPELLDNPFMRGGGGAARIYPISANITTADSHAGTFSAACAIHLWRGGALPGEYGGHAFTCDPTGNLVHHDRLELAGATFAAHRIGENIEFLRSRDNWFRPVYLATGPDGALYICDMYRKTIEHPEYLPVEVRQRTDFESGKGMGRIWRATGATSSKTSKSRQGLLATASNRTLVDELESPNAWRRDTAFRLLVERRDAAAVKHLQRGLEKTDFAPAVSARLHLLALQGALDEMALLAAMKSASAGVREIALRLAEPRLANSPKLQSHVLELAEDADARVRFQAALAIGAFLRESSTPADALAALAGIARRDAADKWTRAAALSSATGRERELLATVLRGQAASEGSDRALLTELGRLLHRAVPPAGHAALLREILSSATTSFDSLAALLTGLAEARPELLSSMAAAAGGGTERQFSKLINEAHQLVGELSAPNFRRVLAAGLLAGASDPSFNSTLLLRLQPGEPAELQSAAIRALTRPGNGAGVRELLAAGRWAVFTPALRGIVLGAVLNQPEHHGALLDAIESGAVLSGAVDSSRREQLKKSKDEAIRQRAEKLFVSGASGDRRKAFEEARACLTLKPAPTNGREVFRRLCASCHRLDREGVAVGPDLFDIRNQPKESILLHIVIPEQEIAPNFANYTCETKDGRVLSGLIAAESASGVTLRQAQGLEETVARDNIASLAASALSLMPQELEKGLTPQELADLLGYLKAGAE